MEIILVVSIFWLIACFYFMWRNNAVYKEKQRVLKIVSRLAQEDIDSGKAWLERYRVYNQVSYYSMLLKFWKPVRSFYAT